MFPIVFGTSGAIPKKTWTDLENIRIDGISLFQLQKATQFECTHIYTTPKHHNILELEAEISHVIYNNKLQKMAYILQHHL